MKAYSVHVRDSGASPKVVLVKEGFSWPAALFGVLWALALGLWETALVLFVAQLALGFAAGLALGDASASANAVVVGSSIITGLVFGELQRWNLARRGIVETETVSADSKPDAEARYLDENPFVLARLAGGP